MDIKHDLNSIRLTSSEIGELWTSYIYDSLSKCVLSHFSSKCKDEDINSLIQSNLDVLVKSKEDITKIFNSVEFPIPIGFSDEDVKLDARKLYSDTFMLHYIKLKTGVSIIL